MAVGRISGPLLKANLLRNGVDLAFETDLLYLDVNNLRVGVKTNNPSHDLHVNGTTRTTTLEVTNQLDIGEITVTNNTISTSASQLTLNPAGLNPVVYQQKIVVDDLDIENNSITANVANTDIELTASGTGRVVVFSNTLVNGDLHATGTITADGDIQLGDANTDNVVFNADVDSDIIPNLNIQYDLGSTSKRWKDLWANDIQVANLDISSSFLLDGVDLTLRPGNTFYVSENGSNSRTGTHQNDPFLTVKHALSVATAGDTVYIYSGTYTEIMPLTVPVGVAIKGAGIRSVIIQPTVGTISNDVFLLNGEVTIEDLTVTGFRYNSVANTGHAFRFANNSTVTSRSPYVKNVSVITSGSTTSVSDPRGFNAGDAGRGAYLDGSVANASSREAAMLFHSATFITPGVDAITAINGVRVEWLNCFTYFANRGFVGLSGSTGFAGTGSTQLRLDGVTGTLATGQTLTYYSTFPTVLASGTISSIASDGKITLTGKVTGLQTAVERGGKTITANGNAKLSQSVKKFGNAALLLDGTSDFASVVSDADFGFASQDFCLEAWLYPTTTGTYRTIFDLRNNSSDTSGIILGLSDINALYFYYNGNYRVGPVGSVPLNQWTHVALARVSGITRAFVGGTQVGSNYTDSNVYPSRGVRIGADPNGNFAFTGSIDDVRISKGAGRYSSNFTAPVSTLNNDSNTVLLSRFNGVNNSTTFIDETVLLQDIRSSGGATASKITLVDYSDFGVEVRSIGSANVYGNFGAVGDGVGVIMYLIGHNMAYIGTGLRSDNDVTYVNQPNEVVETNGAKIYYSSVDHKGDFRVGDLFYVNQQTGEVTFTSANFNINSSQGLTFTNGSNVTYIDGNEIDTGNLKLSGNTLESVTGPLNLASANDQINLLNNVSIAGNLDVVGNVTIGGNIILGDEITDSINFVAGINSNLIPNITNTYDIGTTDLRWKDLYANRALVGNISITGNQITTTNTNGNLELVANGTGHVALEGFVVQENQISTTTGDMTLQPSGTGIVDINSTKSVVIPVGTEIDRPSVPQTGMVRFNTTMGRFEGYNGTTWVFLDGVTDLDGNTKVTAELTPGANDDTIRFYTNGVVVADLNSTRLNVTKVVVDDIEINGSSITNTAGGNLSLQTAGSGNVVVENFNVNGSSITNTVSNAVTTLTSTGTGYVRIAGQGGFVVPSGSQSFRPTLPVTGMMRFDTSLGRMEVYDGTDWISVAGAATGVTRAEVEDLALQYAIALG
jgi:hypothetical protein